MMMKQGVRRTFRALVCLALACAAAACGGGGGGGVATAEKWQPLPDVALRNGAGVVRYKTEGEGNKFRLQCTVRSDGYWGAKDAVGRTSHVALVTRQPESADSIKGSGLAIGRTGDLGYLNIDTPRFSIETWAPGAGNLWSVNRDSYLPPDRLGPVLSDATDYPFTLETDGKTVRYTVAGYDSGPWEDRNTLFVSGRWVMFADAFQPLGSWTMAFTGCRYLWSAS